MADFLTKSIHVNFPNLHLDLQSLESFYNRNLVELSKRGIQYTPSVYAEDDIWGYLVETYGLNKDMDYLKEYSSKIYTLTNAHILRYASEQVENKELKGVLELLAETRKIYDNLRSLQRTMQEVSNDRVSSTISPRANVRHGHIYNRVHPNVVTDLIYQAPKTKSKDIHISNYGEIYYEELEKEFVKSIPKAELGKWHFLKGYTRSSEMKYLKEIIEGQIEATTTIGKRVQEKYMNTQLITSRGKDYIYLQTIQTRRELLAELKKQVELQGYQILDLDDYQVIIGKQTEKSVENNNNKDDEIVPLMQGVPAEVTIENKSNKQVKNPVTILTGYYVYDYDNKKFMDYEVINRILGQTGEFSRQPQYKDQYGYYLINDLGEYEKFYRVEKEEDLVLDDIKEYWKKQKYEGGNTLIINTLINTEKLSTEYAKISRMEQAKYFRQGQIHWTDFYAYSTERKQG